MDFFSYFVAWYSIKPEIDFRSANELENELGYVRNSSPIFTNLAQTTKTGMELKILMAVKIEKEISFQVYSHAHKIQC